jgi:hypothetical protein
MNTVANPTATRKCPVAFYGWLHDQHGIFLQVGGEVTFRDDATQCWQPVDLPTLATWAVLNGRVDLAEAQHLADGNRVVRCSRTLTPITGSSNN